MDARGFKGFELPSNLEHILPVAQYGHDGEGFHAEEVVHVPWGTIKGICKGLQNMAIEGLLTDPVGEVLAG